MDRRQGKSRSMPECIRLSNFGFQSEQKQAGIQFHTPGTDKTIKQTGLASLD